MRGTGYYPKPDTWVHVLLAYDGSTVKTYANAELIDSQTGYGAIMDHIASQDEFRIGARMYSNGYHFEGQIDDAHVYNRAISVAEINDLYGRMAYWKLDETSGTIAVDSTEHGNDGTYRGAPTLGVVGAFTSTTATAVELNGSTQDITTGKKIMNDLATFSMMGWVQINSPHIAQSFFGQNDLFELGIHKQSGQIHLWTAHGEINAHNQFPIGKWTHVAVVGDGVEMKIYLNGRENISGGQATSNYGSSNFDFMLGAGVYTAWGHYLDGKLDEVQLFDRAVTPEEIRAIYKEGRPPGIRILSWVEVR